MEGRITLPFWPTAHDCLSWSKDDQIAVAGGDRVAVLSPQFSDTNSDTNTAQRQVEIFEVNGFTEEEVPNLNPLGFKNFSMGEELSSRHVHQLAWSPPGLGQHRKCVLAILSSNHVLSLWQYDGKPATSQGWKRKLVVNHSIRAHYERTSPAGLSAQERLEHIQVSQRVRSFAWSPPTYKSHLSDIDEHWASYGWGQQYLAVATEGGDTFLLQIESPYDSLEPTKKEWAASIRTALDTRNLAKTVLPPSSTAVTSGNNFGNNPAYVVDYIVWGPWTDSDGSESSCILSFIASGNLFGIRLVSTTNDEKITMTSRSVHHVKGQGEKFCGPLTLCEKTGLLIAFSEDKIWSIDVTSQNPLWKGSYHHLDGRWDEITGVALSGIHPKERRVHLTSLLSCGSAPTCALALPLVESSSSTEIFWQHKIQETKAAYSAEHKLAGNVQERVYGIAASPLGNFVATCSSMHPSDSMAYVINSEEKCVVNITHEPSVSGGKPFPSTTSLSLHSEVSAETLLATCMAQVKANIARGDPSENEDSALLRSISGLIKMPTSAGNDTLTRTNGDDLKTFYQNIRRSMYCSPEIRRAQIDTLIVIAQKRSLRSHVHPDSTRRIVVKLAKETLAARAAVLKMKEVGKWTSAIIEKHGNVCRDLDQEYTSTAFESNKRPKEECIICQQLIEFESIRWARCEDEHQFLRCGMTFLAIQEPGIVKQCGICGSTCLNEATFPKTTASNSDSDENTSEAFVQTFLSACDLCIYCGGKFKS